MKFSSKSVGANINKIRKIKGVKARTAAVYIGLSESAYTKYERGETLITLEFLNKISEYLNIEPYQIFEFDTNKMLQ